MFYKLPSNTDLSNTSYRCRKDTDDVIYIEYNSGYIDDAWENIDESEMIEIAPEWFPSELTPEPTQLDIIQAAVEKSNDELRQEGADALTEELIASGII